MALQSICELTELIGPLLGPNMVRLVGYMRKQHAYDKPAIPSLFAMTVLQGIGESEQAPSLDECPEIFAAKALQAFNQEVDMQQAQADSEAFQKLLNARRR